MDGDADGYDAMWRRISPKTLEEVGLMTAKKKRFPPEERRLRAVMSAVYAARRDGMDDPAWLVGEVMRRLDPGGVSSPFRPFGRAVVFSRHRPRAVRSRRRGR